LLTNKFQIILQITHLTWKFRNSTMVSPWNQEDYR